MKTILREWWLRYFSKTEAGILFSYIIIGFLILMIFHKMLAPVFVSVVLAYLLDWLVLSLQKIKVPHILAVIIAFILFIAVVVMIFLGLMPLLSSQLNNLINEMPRVVVQVQSLLTNLPTHFTFISSAQINSVIAAIQSKMGHYGQIILSYSFRIIPNIVAVVVYLVMVPMLVYFFLMDKNQIMRWIGERFIPKQRQVLTKVWNEVHIQIGNYVRGKVLEAIIVAIVTYLTFLFMGLQYALLLGALVGLSVFIPYIGAIVVTIPVVIVSLLQWGWSAHFLWLMVAYAIITALDANVLVPLLFSEAVSLHPVAIIIAVLVFGGLWGFWGIFFAIPLAALVKAILDNWPVAK